MSSILLYLMKVVIASGLLYLLYFLLLKNTTYFRLNRFYLLMSFIMPPVLPLIHISVSGIPEYYSLSSVLSEITISPQRGPDTCVYSYFNYWQWVYLCIVLFFMIRMIIGCLSVFKLYSKGTRTVQDGITVVVCHRAINPFSLLNSVYISPAHANEDTLTQIMAHEKAHITQKHCIDVFISEIMCSVFWINPFFWKMKDSLKSTHEYLADRQVREQGFDLAGYFLLLLNHIAGIRIGLANNFNQSLTLKRMQMMKKEQSPRYKRWLYLLTLPVVVCIFAAISCQHSADKNGSTISLQRDRVQDAGDTVCVTAEQMPVFGKDDKALAAYLSSEIKYPREAREKGIQGKVFVTFVVNGSGKVNNAKVLEPVNPLLDAEAIRVVYAMPDWTPGKSKGKAVSVQLTLPINFKLK